MSVEMSIDPAPSLVGVDEDSRQVWLGGRELALSGLRFDLLALLVRNAGHVVSRRFIMRQVWGSDRATSKTIDMHIGFLRRALGDRVEAPTYIRTVRGIGFIIPKDRVTPGRERRPRALQVRHDGEFGSFTLGDFDLGAVLKDITVRLERGGRPVVTVGLAVAEADLDLGEPRIVVPPEAVELLVQLGWTPPPPDPPEPPRNE